jgi:hypothetical protein
MEISKDLEVDEHRLKTQRRSWRSFAKALGNKLGSSVTAFVCQWTIVSASGIDLAVETGWFGKPNSNAKWWEDANRVFAFL